MTIDLRNKKILVENLSTEQKISIQNEAFRQGFSWVCDTNSCIRHLDKGAYYFWRDYDIAYSGGGETPYFHGNEKEEITYEDIFPTTNPRPHAELIKQWADDDSLVIESRSKLGGCWMEVTTPTWYPDQEYRIKPVEPVEAPQRSEVDERIDSLEKELQALKKARGAEKTIQAGDYIRMRDLTKDTYDIVCKAFEKAGYPRVEWRSWDDTPSHFNLVANPDTVRGPRFLTCQSGDPIQKRRRYVSEFI